MPNALDSLFPLYPNEGTLACLIHQAVKKFGDETCLAIGKNNITYNQLDHWSDNIAAFLRGNNYHKNSMLFVQLDGTEESFIVMLAGVKAGIILTECNGTLAEATANKFFKKSIVTFANGFFEAALKKISFAGAIKIGEAHLFFNIPFLQADDIVFALITTQRMISHKAVLEMISASLPEQDHSPFIDFFYRLKNNCQKVGKQR